ncbi:MAG: 2OG-Fe(II) oxygenase [Thermoanaerobaculia bacterium]|nr:2OG-Fe(II) oxygenase [Thermoanaerobaculia bacterium]
MSTDTFELFGVETDALAEHGWVVVPDFLAPSSLDSLREEARRLWSEGQFSSAEVGQGKSLQVRPEIRGDLTCWIEPTSASPGIATYFAAVEELRQAVNRRLFLGCFDFEAHLAVYPPGAFYHKHLDRIPSVAHRLVSVILYLEPDWRGEDGGQLRLYLGEGGVGPTHDVLPAAGSLVAFLAGQVHHEVLPTNRSRWSITGWLRART